MNVEIPEVPPSVRANHVLMQQVWTETVRTVRCALEPGAVDEPDTHRQVRAMEQCLGDTLFHVEQILPEAFNPSRLRIFEGLWAEAQKKAIRGDLASRKDAEQWRMRVEDIRFVIAQMPEYRRRMRKAGRLLDIAHDLLAEGEAWDEQEEPLELLDRGSPQHLTAHVRALSSVLRAGMKRKSSRNM